MRIAATTIAASIVILPRMGTSQEDRARDLAER
jgi:hypothetical protein